MVNNWGFALGRTGNVDRSIKQSDLVKFHHNFMCVYGWIPKEEFYALPLQTILDLNPLVVEELRKDGKFRLCLMKGLGYKGQEI